ncbi:MAG: oligosaccharide flippase family protein [Anaerolineae bacterium]|nr:oligosaccharide flippase family protein [Anaerolineae bacterium]
MSNSAGSTALTSIAIRGTAWRYSAFFIGKLMVFISTVILARLLTKDEFGVVGYAVTAIAFLDIVSDLGVGEALIYYPEGKDTFTTAFWISLAISIALFVFTWVVAPFLAIYFRDP